MKTRKPDLIVTRNDSHGKPSYQLHEIDTGWKGHFRTAQKVQNHIEMWFADHIVEWIIVCEN